MLVASLIVTAQDLKITKIELNPRMQTALVNQEVDPVGQRKCAVLHVVTEGLTPEERNYKLHFQLDNAHSIVKTVQDGGEIQLYVPDGTVKLTVKSEMGNYRCDFRDHGFKDGVESLTDYNVYIVYNRPAAGPKEEDMGGQYFVLTVTPKSAIVYIDGEVRKVTEGEMKAMLPYGEHSYRIEAPSFVSDEGRFTIGREKVTKTVNLVSALARLNLTCADAAAELYLNDNKIGTGSWNGSLDAGMYVLEARKTGCRTVKQSLTLAKQEQKTLTIDAPQPIYGKLNFDSEPGNADVYLDGKKIGTSPDIFSNILVGIHKVELRKEGYENATKQINIEEGKIAQECLILTKKQQPAMPESSSASGALTFTVNGITFKMLPVEGGTFTMGATAEQGSDADSDEKPTHSVTLSSYYMGETEVTQALWQAVMGSNPSNFKGNNLPVENVSWNDCQTFINKLNQLLAGQLGGKRFALPTEAQWEYAARGGKKSRGYKYSGSNTLDNVAWYTSTTNDSGTKPVGTKTPNELGLYDMSGNVWEWCSDWYGSYGSGAQTNPTGSTSGSRRVGRGGSWFDGAGCCRVSNRSYGTPDRRNYILGLRLSFR